MLLLAVTVAITLAGCPSTPPGSEGGGGTASAGSKKRIIILTNGPDPFWDTCEAGAKAAENELGLMAEGFVVDFQRGDFTDKKQIDMLKRRFEHRVRAGSDYWRQHRHANHACFIELGQLEPIFDPPIVPRLFGSGWLILPVTARAMRRSA